MGGPLNIHASHQSGFYGKKSKILSQLEIALVSVLKLLHHNLGKLRIKTDGY